MSGYRKTVEIAAGGRVWARVIRTADNEEVGLALFQSFWNTAASIEKQAIKAHAWADEYGAMCARQEHGAGT